MLLGEIPLRLLVCLGFEMSGPAFSDALCALVVDDRFLEEVLTETLGEGAGCITGESKKAEGDGIVIVAIKIRRKNQNAGIDAVAVAVAVYEWEEGGKGGLISECGGGRAPAWWEGNWLWSCSHCLSDRAHRALAGRCFRSLFNRIPGPNVTR